jgi:hypothetical protein
LPPADSALDKAFAEAEVGDAAKAPAEAQRQKDAAGNDVLMNVEYAPSVQAAVALRQGKPGEAIALLQADAPYELRDPTVPYLRGLSYLAAHQPLAAAAEFEKLADRPWLAEPAAPLMHFHSYCDPGSFALSATFPARKVAGASVPGLHLL